MAATQWKALKVSKEIYDDDVMRRLVELEVKRHIPATAVIVDQMWRTVSWLETEYLTEDAYKFFVFYNEATQ
jgi:hypothetical protein